MSLRMTLKITATFREFENDTENYSNSGLASGLVYLTLEFPSVKAPNIPYACILLVTCATSHQI